MDGHSSSYTLNSPSFGPTGWNNIIKCGYGSLIDALQMQLPIISISLTKNKVITNPLSSTKITMRKSEISYVDICTGIHSKKVDVINSPVVNEHLAQFGCGKQKKCTICVQHWEKDMHENICGRIGTIFCNRNFGQDRCIWNTIPLFKQMLRSSHIGPSSSIEV